MMNTTDLILARASMRAEQTIAAFFGKHFLSDRAGRKLIREVRAAITSTDVPTDDTVGRCIHILRGNLLAGYGPDARAQRDADIAILESSRADGA